MVRRQAQPITAFLFTDERVSEAALLKAAQKLPSGSGIVFRHYKTEPTQRARLYAKLRPIARRRGLMLLIAGELPHRFADHDGRHGRRARHGVTSMPVHDARELAKAARLGPDIVFISPLFATRSHPGAPVLGALGYKRLAKMAKARGLAPMALGGMNARRAAMLKGPLCAGYGAIDTLLSTRRVPC